MKTSRTIISELILCGFAIAFVSSILPSSAQISDRSLKKSESVFTVNRMGKIEPGKQKHVPNEQSIDLAVIEFKNDGSFENAAQLPAALETIRKGRQENPNGAIVMVFIHGWHHGAQWEDNHFDGFRKSLIGLALREAERYKGSPAGRRVIGIYFGWHGQVGGIFSSRYVEETTFWNRYNVAESIGKSQAIKQAIHDIINATKDQLDPKKPPINDSPLIMMGHSMGALMLESAFLSLLGDPRSDLIKSYPASDKNVTRVESNGQPVTFPDLVLLLNSATESKIAKGIIQKFIDKRLKKVVGHKDFGLSYEAPLLISVTAANDTATQKWFPRAKGTPTDGNDPALLTHQLRLEGGALCPPKQLNHLADDFNQAWHCLRNPNIQSQTMTSIGIDLPQTEKPRDHCHIRYRLEPLQSYNQKAPFWVFQVPSEIIDEHNGIYENVQSNLLLMALMQASGTIMSLAEKWEDVFERNGSNVGCTLSVSRTSEKK